MSIQAQLADGRVLEFPEGTDPAIIQAKVKEFMQTQRPAQETMNLDPNQGIGALEAGTIAAGRGMMSIMRGLGLADPEDPATKAAFSQLEEQRPIATMTGEVVGQSAPFLLGGPAVGAVKSIGGRALASAGLGALEGATIAKGEGGTTDEAIGSGLLGGTVAGALELAFPIISRTGGKLIRKVLGRNATAPIMDATGEVSSEFQTAMDRTGLTLDDIAVDTRRQLETGSIQDPAALLRKNFLEEQGIIPTRSNITGEASDFQAQQELFKRSGRVRQAIEGQDEALSRGFDNAISATGGSANRSNSTAFDFIADRSIDLDASINDAYKQARNLATTAKVVKPEKLVSEVKKIAGSGQATGGLPSAVRDILKEKGVLVASRGKGLDVINKVDANVAEQIRTDMNALFDSLSPYGKGKLRALKNALDDDVADAVGEDVFKEARAAKAKFEKDLSRAKVNKFDKRKKELVRDILENKIHPDRFFDEAVLSKPIRSTDLEQLKRYLLLDADGPGIDAWNDIRAEAMQRIKDQAFPEVGGVKALSRAKIDSALDRFGRDKLRVLFSQDERKFLNNMKKVAEFREPVRGTALGRGPSAQAVGALEAALKKIALVGGVFQDIAIDTRGKITIQPPALAPLKVNELSRLTPVGVAGVAATHNQEEN